MTLASRNAPDRKRCVAVAPEGLLERQQRFDIPALLLTVRGYKSMSALEQAVRMGVSQQPA